MSAILALHSGCSRKGGSTGDIQIRVTDDVVLSNPKLLGINLGQSTFYGDQQLVYRPFSHGGFRKGSQVHFLRVGDSTSNSVTDSSFDASTGNAAIPISMTGGTYYVATGDRAGESGRIVAHKAGSATLKLEHRGTPITLGNYLWLRGPLTKHARPVNVHGEPLLGIGDFRPVSEETVTQSFVEASENSNDQYLRFTFPVDGQRRFGGVRHYLACTKDTDYTIRLRARSQVPGARLGLQLTHFGVEGGGAKGNTVLTVEDSELTSEWKEYVFRGHTQDLSSIHDSYSALKAGAWRQAGSPCEWVEFDYIELTDEGLRSDSGFSREVEEALIEARCGVVRFHGVADAGADVASMTAASARESSWTFFPMQTGHRFMATNAVVDECLTLCETIDADAWFSIGGANTPDDWYALISYIAAPADFDEHSRRRAEHGYPEPWIDKVPTIYLEIGNEWWNSIFRPYFIWEPEKYAQLCQTILKRIKSHPHWDADRIQLIFGGWAANTEEWTEVVTAAIGTEGHISIAPYLLSSLDKFGTDSEKYGTLFADVDDYLRNEGDQAVKSLLKSHASSRIAIYELNTHLTKGAAPPAVASEICPSLASGVAVLDQALSLMETLQADPITFFTLLQRSHGSGAEMRLGLWGNLIRDRSGTLRPRPVWEGLRLANHELIEGSMVLTSISGSPTWDQSQNGSVRVLRDVPQIHAYSFLVTDPESGKRRANVLVVNRSLRDTLPVAIYLPFTPAPDVRQVALTGDHPNSNNEQVQRVTLQEDSTDNFTQGGYLRVPPHSAVVFQFHERS